MQVLPVKGMAGMSQQRLRRLFGNMPVEYLEDTWNTAESMHQVWHDWRRKTVGAPTWKDAVLFPMSASRASKLYAELQGLGRPREIGHKWKERYQRFGPTDLFVQSTNLVEVHPGLWMTTKKIIEKAASYSVERPLVVDLWHLRHEATDEWRVNRPAHIKVGTLLGRWQDELPRLLPYSSVIHVAPSRDWLELQACLRGEPTELEEMLACIRMNNWQGDFVVEAILGPIENLNFPRLCEVLEDFHDWVEERVG